MDHGTILVEVTTAGEALPVEGALVQIYSLLTGSNIDLYTGPDGRTPSIAVPAPSLIGSLEPGMSSSPYYSYNVTVYAPGYTNTMVEGVQVFPGIQSVLPIHLHPLSSSRTIDMESDIFSIPPNGLQLTQPREPEGPPEGRILGRVYIPEYITVHLGRPNSNARNVRVSFPDYIKNVASSEIYPTWPENALRANIHAQIGFALNRVFTEWYPSRGYPFDITNSTAYDQYFVEGRNYFDSISRIVDQIFNVYPRRKGRLEPLFSSYCNGSTVTCSGLSQWGTVNLANQGYAPLRILQYYYGNDVELTTASEIQDLEGSYPGTPLRKGSRSNDVLMLQRQLNRIRRNYPGIPAISNPDGIFGDQTLAAVRAFQRIFDLSVDGIVGKATWYKVQYIYAAIKRLAELESEGEFPSSPAAPYPGYLLRQGSRGESVRIMQSYLADLSGIYRQIPAIAADGIFGSRTRSAVLAFQKLFGLAADGIVGPATWNMLANIWSQNFL